jgi:hypothetical protein
VLQPASSLPAPLVLQPRLRQRSATPGWAQQLLLLPLLLPLYLLLGLLLLVFRPHPAAAVRPALLLLVLLPHPQPSGWDPLARLLLLLSLQAPLLLPAAVLLLLLLLLLLAAGVQGEVPWGPYPAMAAVQTACAAPYTSTE